MSTLPIPPATPALLDKPDWHQSLLLGGAALARTPPRTPDLLRPANPATIHHQFRNILHFTELTWRALVRAQGELASQIQGYSAELKRVEDVTAAVQERLRELKRVRDGREVEEMRKVVVGSKARHLGLCEDEALGRSAEDDEESHKHCEKCGECFEGKVVR